MLSAPLAAPSPQRYYAGSDSCRASYTTRQASPVHPLAFWTCHPQPRRAPGTSRALPPRASGRLVAEPGFAETLGSSPLHAAESGSYSYSLPVRLQLLPTPSRSDATTLPLERRSCFQLYVRQLHTVRTHTVLTNELTDALGAGFKPALSRHTSLVRYCLNHPPTAFVAPGRVLNPPLHVTCSVCDLTILFADFSPPPA